MESSLARRSLEKQIDTTVRNVTFRIELYTNEHTCTLPAACCVSLWFDCWSRQFRRLMNSCQTQHVHTYTHTLDKCMRTVTVIPTFVD